MYAVARPASLANSTLPFGIALIVAFISFLPLGAHGSVVTLGPQLVLCVVFHWALRAPHLLPPVAVFVLGLGIDLFSAGPLGFWGLVYLVAYALIAWRRETLGSRGFFMTWLAFSVVAGIVTGVAWALGSIYFGTLIGPEPLMISCGLTIAVYPLMAVLFGWASGPRKMRGLKVRSL